MAPKKLRAKFAGTCRSCDKPFPKGAAILWAAGRGAQHEACADERAMQRMEAEGDRAQTAREEAAKFVARNLAEGRCPDGCCGPGADMPWTAADEERYQQQLLAERGLTQAPLCHGCGRYVATVRLQVGAEPALCAQCTREALGDGAMAASR